jgi:hypothetical protein
VGALSRRARADAVDVGAKSDNLSDMKKAVSVAEFTKRFGPITSSLAAGESVEVTSYGKLHGRYIREGARQRRPKIDLGKRVAQETYDATAGQQLINAIVQDS